MQYPIKIIDYYWASGSTKKMIYKDDKGKEFLGSPHDVVLGKTYMVEISDAHSEDGYTHIIKFVGQIGK